MSLKLHHLFWVAGWLLAAFAVLSLADLPGNFGQNLLCGEWGCGGPLMQVLAAMHLFWGLVLVPPVAWGTARLPPRRLRWTGALLLALGVVGIGLVVARDVLVWLPSVAPRYRDPYILPRRTFYSLATLSDVPLVQVALAGTVCWFLGKRREARACRAVVEGTPGPAGPVEETCRKA
ncbi:MAG: hypothetical protein HYS12_05005 [Planctomycetes bacterium]|nr:hypothetical protein [Planctomycetota bacterium]